MHNLELICYLSGFLFLLLINGEITLLSNHALIRIPIQIYIKNVRRRKNNYSCSLRNIPLWTNLTRWLVVSGFEGVSWLSTVWHLSSSEQEPPNQLSGLQRGKPRYFRATGTHQNQQLKHLYIYIYIGVYIENINFRWKLKIQNIKRNSDVLVKKLLITNILFINYNFDVFTILFRMFTFIVLEIQNYTCAPWRHINPPGGHSDCHLLHGEGIRGNHEGRLRHGYIRYTELFITYFPSKISLHVLASP